MTLSYSGRLSKGPSQAFIDAIISFVYNSLPGWRDDLSRTECDNENQLNESLSTYLNDKSANTGMFLFTHESGQNGRRKVDLAAKGRGINRYKTYAVFEGKRLPAPDVRRKREYVKGTNRISGGIERFKTGDHGGDCHTSAIIGYIEDGTPAEWLANINQWISELATDSSASLWTQQDLLNEISYKATEKAAFTNSIHRRNAGTTIKLYHLWIEMSRSPNQ